MHVHNYSNILLCIREQRDMEEHREWKNEHSKHYLHVLFNCVVPLSKGWVCGGDDLTTWRNPHVLTCMRSVRFCKNSLPQVVQDSGLRPCWRSWLTSSNFLRNPAPQSGHTYGLCPPWKRECITRCSSLEKFSPHI